jgi:hypothetical protein
MNMNTFFIPRYFNAERALQAQALACRLKEQGVRPAWA